MAKVTKLTVARDEVDTATAWCMNEAVDRAKEAAAEALDQLGWLSEHITDAFDGALGPAEANALHALTKLHAAVHAIEGHVGTILANRGTLVEAVKR